MIGIPPSAKARLTRQAAKSIYSCNELGLRSAARFAVNGPPVPIERSFVMEPIRKAQERAAKIVALQRLIDEAEASGPSTLSQAEPLPSARREAGVAFNPYTISDIRTLRSPFSFDNALTYLLYVGP
jgi:hypothetical protein